MASKDREVIKLESPDSKKIYYTKKNKKNTPEKLTLKKFCPFLRKVVTFKETGKAK